ncbi:cysteine--tRNA ligase [Picrophilus oshimae]|uniref:Cysteine--tRNA ligase n=1 Tax=Picrophilus torridus (strain ATCC 700027 / DSM 9790 / JCM 10055 / NBRC 100828 / KAW 2/3) TaxID=1122961 RepID=A0A8G2FXQ9_PICTO|nr:cysteine--tRNA ligase [Picrophilus oshimae]SMD31457.1 cysteinyl-tRNA synthetase [Picrophilus oshimae DSM 9789]
MRFYDTLSGSVKEFKPMHKNRINIFVCGPTVYDDFHLGHARTYIFFDTIVKFMRSIGYSVFYLQNITDIDDKIIKRAHDEDRSPEEIANRYFNEYLRIMSQLGIDSVNYYARATLYIDEIISQIKRMIKKGYAYETSDGVYFCVRKFRDYGELSKQNLDNIIENARGVLNEDKRNPEDFVLWKKMKPGEPYWESPWGKGRPGWHIEDTAITETYFGDEYDIHGGGSDLIFPHHEAEIAQMRSISNKRYLAHYWIHTGMINVNREKMSKSLKNYITIKDVLKEYKPNELRFAVLNANFNTSIEFSMDSLNESREALSRIINTYRKLKKIDSESGDYMVDSDYIIKRYMDIMSDNFDTRSLIRELMDFVTDINKNMDHINKDTAGNIIRIFDYINSFMNIIPEERSLNNNIIDSVLNIRSKLRSEKRYDLSDYIRMELEKSGIHIEDKNNKTQWWIE